MTRKGGFPWLLRQARDAGAWRPSHARLLAGQVVNRARNERAGCTDADHLRAAAQWLERAQDATGNGGVAGRYRLGSGWTAAYPETTGYIIQTFLALASEPGGERFRTRAADAVNFLLPLQFPSGAFPGGEVRNGAEPSFFNTGQIVAGLTAWHRATGEGRSEDAARKAADWLISFQEPDGAFRQHLYHGIVTTYGAHASCWIAELGQHLGEPRYLDAARRHVDWVLTHRDPETGWIDLAGFSEDHHRARQSVTHTIAYTLAGVLLTARTTGHDTGIAAVEQAALGIARRLELSGWLPGILDHRWRPASAFACLTGNCQMALVWFALFDRTGDARFLNAGLKAIDLVKKAQPLENADPGIRGGIPGSDPVWGDYIRMALPNWAPKFFIDALLQKRAALEALPSRRRGVAVLPADVPLKVPAATSSRARAPQLRVVVLASPASRKVARMLDTWEGFRPAAVVVLARPRPSARQRLWLRLSEHGATPVVRPKSPPALALAGSTAHSGGNVRSWCARAGIPVVEVDSFDSPDALQAIRDLKPDLFVFAGGAILRGPLLAIPRLGTLNAHMGLLPFYRGMNVAEWACFHGDAVGCTVHLIDPGIDTGEILCVRPVPIDGARSVAALRDAVDDAQMTLLGEVVGYVTKTGVLPPGRRQTPVEGRQFFRMHQELVERLEAELTSGTPTAVAASRAPGREAHGVRATAAPTAAS